MTPEEEIDIESHANEIKQWIKNCPKRCMAAEFLSNYVLLLDAYLVEKGHNKNQREFPGG